MAEVGRPTELNDELLVKIRNCILEGKNYLETAKELDIPYETFTGWTKRNYNQFADKLLLYKQERRLRKAEENIDYFLDVDEMNTGMTMRGEEFTFKDPKIMKIKADTSVFVAETLGKKHYSKKTEVEDLTPKKYIILDGEDKL